MSNPQKSAVEGDTVTDSNSPEKEVKYGGITKLRNFLAPRRLELGMWVARIFVTIFTVLTIFPVLGNAYAFYQRTLIANAATSALRLHQRLPKPYRMTKEFFAYFLLEDSCHHLFFSVMFLYMGPVSFALVPVFLFATLHVASFALQMLEIVYGPACRQQGVGSLCFVWTLKTTWILKMAASAEAFLMALVVLNCFRGTMSIIAPFAYYRFLSLRYASRRNHYTRLVFYETRIVIEKFIMSGKCPRMLGNVLSSAIGLLSKLAPSVPSK